MVTKTVPFDAAKHLKSRRAQAELLTDALETGDSAYIANALGVIARARGMSDVAREAGVTRAALYKALSRRGDPRLTTLLGVVKSLGFKLSVRDAGVEQWLRGEVVPTYDAMKDKPARKLTARSVFSELRAHYATRRKARR